MVHLQLKPAPLLAPIGFLLLLAILLPLACSPPAPASPEVAPQALPVNSKDLALKFTTSVRSIFEDSQGNYWFGSHGEGLALFDGASIAYFTTQDGLSHNQIRSIQEDEEGTIWLGTAGGVSSYDGSAFTQHTPVESDSPQSGWTKTEGDLWFNAGPRAGIYRYDGHRLHYLAFPSPQVINPNNMYGITGLSEGKDNMLWMATYAGVFGYDGDQFTVINDETLEFEGTGDRVHIRSILEDSRGRLWMGNNGIGVLLREDGRTVNFSDLHHLIHPGSTRAGDRSPAGTLEHVFAIAEDGEGNIWFGDRDTGAWKYDGQSVQNYGAEFGLTSNFVRTIYKDKQGELWLGLFDGNVFKFDGERFAQQFPKGYSPLPRTGAKPWLR